MKHKIIITLLFSLIFSLILSINAPAFAAAPGVRLKNFREIYYSLTAVTQIDENDADLKLAFSLVKDRLPRTGSPLEFGSPSLMALTEFSATVCGKVISREKSQNPGERILFQDINFSRGPVQFSSYLVEVVTQRLARIFWQREIKPNEIALFEKQVFDFSKDDMVSVPETEKTVLSLCTNFASSLAFVTK